MCGTGSVANLPIVEHNAECAYCKNFLHIEQGDHFSGKPRNVREFDSCQGNVRDFTENEGNVGELSGKKSCQGNVA